MAYYDLTQDGIDVQGFLDGAPTLSSAPTSSTTTYTKSGQTIAFVVGQFARVAVTGGYDFYQLKNVSGNTATWEKTTYSVMGASGSGHASGLTPDTPSTAGTTKFLREDGTWQVPTVDVSGKEDKMSITTKSSGTTLSAALNTYYRCTYNVGTLAVTLPTVSETTKVQSVVLYMTFGTSPNLTISAPSGVNVYFHATYDIKANGTYEINCIYNGAAWVVASTKITVS